MGGVMLLASVRADSRLDWPGWSLILVEMLVVPALCLLGGFAGFRLRQRFLAREQIRS